MRAMILAAGRGTRMGALSDLCAKPALPVRGVPVLAWELHWLARHGVREVLLNLHHRADDVRAAATRYGPAGIALEFVEEPRLRGTGGGMAGAADWLRASDPSVVLAGDMLIDLDLAAAVARHRERRAACTLMLREDARAAAFGTLGLANDGRIRRVARAFDLGGETQSGVFVGLRICAPRLFDGWPDAEAFEDLRDVLVPRLESGAADLLGDRLPAAACTWAPVGNLGEYLDVNLHPPPVPAPPEAAGAARLLPGDVVAGRGAEIPDTAQISRAVVWAGEHVPGDFAGHDGVFAGGRFHALGRD